MEKAPITISVHEYYAYLLISAIIKLYCYNGIYIVTMICLLSALVHGLIKLIIMKSREKYSAIDEYSNLQNEIFL